MTTYSTSLRLWEGTPGDPAIKNAWGTALNTNDNLIEAFIYLVGQFDKQAKAAAMEAMGKATTEANANLGAAGEVLNLFVDESIAEDSPFIDVNAVIYYNTMLLSQVYERKLAAGDTDAVAAIRRMSPVAWQHVNLFGTFEFSDEASGIVLGIPEPVNQ